MLLPMSTSDLNREHELLYKPLMSFLNTVQAVVDLDEALYAHRDVLTNVEELFVAEANRRFSSDLEEQHRDAAKIIHDAMHRISESTSLEQRAAEDLFEREGILEDLKSELLDLTSEPRDYWRYSAVWNRIRSRPSNFQLLRKSLLISAVSDFEVLISSVVRAQLSLRPEMMNVDENKYSLRDLEPFESITDFRSYRAEIFADSMLRGGLDEWISWFNRHKLSIPGVTEDAQQLHELFQRRHLLVHNGGIVNQYYLRKVPGAEGVQSGDSLEVTRPYLLQALDTLTSAGIVLTFAVWRKLTNASNLSEIGHRVPSHISYELLKADRNLVVESINPWFAEYAISPRDQIMARVNWWIARKRVHGLDHIREEVERWDVSTLANLYRLAKLALLNMDAEAYNLAQQLLSTNELSVEDWREWPLLEDLRAYEVNSTRDPVDRGLRPHDPTYP